ncbi:hypothetical protein [Curtobacterium sp. Leaf261]|uniref:hypothetical protein n=1 Tax=Curtobacterium sp. Leaf261 TaxID=1736311 RepID=UPI0006F86C7C|nr:hypothetical protein [Curtobacterium sp. Leaf261]KQO59714.1 hypothetical protein ASF23_15570 [Curtobacterium sp. Leaf261]
MTSQPTTGPVPRLQTDTASHATRVARAARGARPLRGLPFTVGGTVAIVLLVLAIVGMLVAGESGRMRAAGNALIVATAFAIIVIAIVVASIPRINRDRVLRRRFPDALVVTVGRGVHTGTRSLVVDHGTVGIWATARDAEPESSWGLETITRAVAVPSRRRIQRTADIVLVVDGRDELFRPFRSAASFAERMPLAAVEDVVRSLRIG